MSIIPIVFPINEDHHFLRNLETNLKSHRSGEVLIDYPTVYIHYWISNTITYEDKHGIVRKRNLYDAYVGESIDVIDRTQKHYHDGKDKSNWQYKLVHTKKEPQFIVIGHKHFNKSFTLAIENRLIEYIISTNNLNVIHNSRGNPQKKFYPDDEFEYAFSKIWGKLHIQQREFFNSESVIKNSAIYKASPLKTLTREQESAKKAIIDKVVSSINKNTSGQIIFVQGEAGTGKTVLTSSTYYDIIKNIDDDKSHRLKCHLVVNHDEQLDVYKQLARRLDLGQNSVHKPTSFIHRFSPTNKVDVCFVDEGHLLLTRGRMSYRGKNQLQDIIDRSRITIVMFDEYQVLTADEYWENQILQEFISRAKQQNNYLSLDRQLRMECSNMTIKWINEFVLMHSIGMYKPDIKYEIKSFESPQELHKEIKRKASKKGTELSRIVATYDWEYNNKKRPEAGDTWAVHVGDWSLPWNYELEK